MKICKKCLIEKEYSNFYKHKRVCKNCYLEHKRNYQAEHRLEIREYSRNKYKERDKESHKKRKREWAAHKRKTDPVYALRFSYCRNLRNILRNQKSKRQDVLGCTYLEFKIYLESKFEPWMNWENRGLYNGEFNYGWDIDHIIPLSSAKSEEEVIKLNHYTNLQPLCSKFNRDIKRDNF